MISVDDTEPWVLSALARYFRLEVAGATASIVPWEREPCVFIMNHTAIFGLEVYLLYAALRRTRPEAPRPITTVWPPFLDLPVVGSFYRAAGCIPMTVDGAVRQLREGRSVLILPEGPDATDVRDRIGPFHAGFMRVAAKANVPIVPFGWAGVDEAMPWFVTTHPTLVRRLMHPTMPHFDFALLPRPPLLRPSKVVFVAGEPIRVGDLSREDELRAEVERVRSVVKTLVERAEALRERRIEERPGERLLHAITRCRRVAWTRRS